MSMTHWKKSNQDWSKVTALCLGTGRFLRSVLVPALVGSGHVVGLIQTRGRSMMEYMENHDDGNNDDATYEVDTILPDGSTKTDCIPVHSVFSLGRSEDKHAFVEALSDIQGIRILGIGVTEAGLANKDTQVMKDLYELLHLISVLEKENQWPTTADHSKLCVIDMDNVPNNGQVLRGYMMAHAEKDPDMQTFLNDRLVFCDTMVDRITSQRPNSQGMVPSCEPLPAKALVVCDPSNSIPPSLADQPGVWIRSTSKELQLDIALKLRIANGTHTAIAHTLALLSHLKTNVLSSDSKHAVFMKYLDALVQEQILPAVSQQGTGSISSSSSSDETMPPEGIVWQDWRQRLVHPQFGLSSFFITQNGTAKGGIRWGPTVIDLIQRQIPVQVSFALAYAVLLRWLTPVVVTTGIGAGIYIGWLESSARSKVLEIAPWNRTSVTEGTEAYADGLHYHLSEGWYEFKCPLLGLVQQLADCAAHPKQPRSCLKAIQSYLLHPDGGNLEAVADSQGLKELSQTVAVLYARMITGDSLQALLDELQTSQHGISFASPCSEVVQAELTPAVPVQPLHYRSSILPKTCNLLQIPVDMESLPDVVAAEVRSVQAIDLHTHLLPPTHGPLCLWGIDELLTYHYLVAEYFMTAPASVSPEAFYAMPKREQAGLIWQALFLDRSPLSEACRGVLTTLTALGMEGSNLRDLSYIRTFYKSYQDRPDGAEDFSERIFEEAGIDYAIMTNIPFDSNETQYWKPQKTGYSVRYRSALRVDPLLAGDRNAIEAILKASGYENSFEGARQYLRDWCATMQPEYMMASTPHDFVLRDGPLDGVRKTGINESAMNQPGAFVAAAAQQDPTCDGAEDQVPSAVNEDSDFLSEVLMSVCEERDLPVALKIGAHRGINPSLKAAGDGMVAFADASMLGRLCARFPKVRFLATFLSRNNQHEACVLANKFRNLHIYGCWWYCNNPSIIQDITSMRLELLGVAFTAQHSDARVVDQLLYKWPHSRAVIANALTNEYKKSLCSGWQPTRQEIRKDVHRLFRGSYEEFMAKSFK